MGIHYSIDLRERISRYITAGHTRQAAARAFGFSANKAVWLAVKYRDRVIFAPKRQGRALGTAGKWRSRRIRASS